MTHCIDALATLWFPTRKARTRIAPNNFCCAFESNCFSNKTVLSFQRTLYTKRALFAQ